MSVGGDAGTGPLPGPIGAPLGGGDGLCCRGFVRGDGDGAEPAVHHDRRPHGHRVQSVDRDDARDAQLPGDDRGMARRATERRRQRDHQRGVQPRGVGGREVLGAQDRRHVGYRHSRFGQALEFGDDAVANVAQVGHAFGHQPAELGEHRHELVDGGHHGGHCGATVGDSLLRGADPRPVLRESRGGRKHLGGRAGRKRGAFA